MRSARIISGDVYSKMPLLYFTLLLTIMLICNVTAFKVITVFGLPFSFTGLFFPISFLLLTLLNESYGHVETERFILFILIGQTLFISVISIVVRLDMGNHIATTGLYYQLYKDLYRLVLSSNLAVGLAYYFTSLLNSKLKCWLLGKPIWKRFLLVNGVGKAILVLCTYPINFFGTLGWGEIAELSVDTWAFKMCMAMVFLLFLKPLKKLNQKVDRMDIFDFGVQYNPLKMFSSGNYGKNYFGQEVCSHEREDK